MDLKTLRQRLKDGRARLVDLKAKAFAENASTEDRTAYTDGLKSCEDTLEQIKLAEREQAIEAAASKGANDPAGGEGAEGGERRPYASPAKTVKDYQKALLPVAAQAKAAILNKQSQESGSGERISPVDLLKQEGYGEVLKELDAKAREQRFKAGLASGVSGGVLLPQPVADEIIPILYPAATFLQGNPRRVQLIGGTYRQARGVGSATAAYVGEGAKKPVGAPTFDDIDMRSHKLAGIVYMTNEAAKWTIGRLEDYVRTDLQRVMGLKMDSAMYFGTGAGATPTGIYNQDGITVIDGSAAGLFANSRAPTYAELDRIASRMMLALTGANIVRSDTWRWTMGYRFQQYLADMRDGNGNQIYPGVDDPVNPRWKGIRILVSNQFAENGGANTDEGDLGLVDFGHVLFAEEEGMTMKTSTEATIDDGGTLVLLWQQNMSAILCEMQHDVTLDQPKAAVRLTHVRAGSPSTVA
ncbi:phage major capsid protein [Methylobacterium radiotolerans]|jgi:HK97 family phage major capsid protein|uniref:phage major capsid protein n=1 Tax=Methylobacterium TaxID=407 RepID=UPI0005E72E97|nr:MULTISPECIES: phage major capsid protein [Methylobacterium]MBN6821749.1 phage major capsid protein [Methylobacterium organophilum]OXE40262.1 phage major capsid protein [Methylobacterium radiotolerans]GAN49699.1 phage major capsid protein, HK97 family [Methylobacterium sp. ME121]